MSSVSPVPSVKLFVVSLHHDPQILQNAVSALEKKWGVTDYTSDDFLFNITDYYEPEMGTDLLRRFYSFETLIPPDAIVDVKLHCMELENEYCIDSNRRVNLDPGYMDTYKLVLASAKYGGQKIYLRNGIYADMTLFVYKRKWQSFPWGFPDFKSGKYDAVLSKIREIYKAQLKEQVF